MKSLRTIMMTVALCTAALFAEKVASTEVDYDFDTQIYSRNGAPFTGTSVMKTSQGEVVKEIDIKAGKLDGFDIMYSKGKPTSKKEYKAGLQDGTTYIYSLTDFTLYSTKEYKAGKLHGLVKTFDAKGVLLTSRAYANGKKEGAFKQYGAANGKLKPEGQYSDNKKSGTWTYYKSDGKTVQRVKEY